MQHAIAILKTQVEACATNAPIHAAAGDLVQSALDLAVRESCLKAIAALESIDRFDACLPAEDNG